MKLCIQEITPRIFWVYSKTAANLAPYFMRFQEHYESPEFQNKVFTVGEFREWYVKTYGDFTYDEDWAGFNFPMSILSPFKGGLFDPLTSPEKSLLSLLKDVPSNGYVIGTNDKDSLTHEICHGLYTTDLDYRTGVQKILDKYYFDVNVVNFITQLEKDYSLDKILDELQAYHADGISEDYKGIKIHKKLRNDLLKFRRTFFERLVR